MKIFFDLETLPASREDIKQQIRDSIKPPGNISKLESIAKWMEENSYPAYQDAYRKTALDGLYGEIFCIAWAIDNEEPICLYRDENKNSIDSEFHLLHKFFERISELTDKHGQRSEITQWIGHYITGFDLRFIWQRCVINGVRPSVRIPYDAKPWDACVFDTKIGWTGASNGYSGAGSLDKLSNVMLGHGKGEINGSNVYDYWLAGEYEKIAEYCKQDVRDCRDLYRRMNFISEVSA